MVLIVEDGTGIPNADSLVSLAAHRAYLVAKGVDDTAFADDALEQALRRASTYISTAFIYKGTPVNGRDQCFVFPMSGLVDAYCNDVASDSVPKEIVLAVSLAAEIETANPGAFAPTSGADGTDLSGVKRVRERVDVLEEEIEYVSTIPGGRVTPVGAISKQIDDLLAPFISSGAASGGSTKFLARA